ncbi:very-long-chain 3-oxoacyl-CoA reductase-like protein At1g24470 [Cucurbita pepo subsp. pepo]|uniref:very-long-chain 3-oxoacyl-CoA reductase-like protein At1g24470 n=1 Tax=Cucurbita pepo subsp. pepo TaxID=3664 RepID=UPI000C9D2DA3|nr:very-long-chain 3-oxoacyl-CoA reductase-like protein At1g24470 [Cucurbita pepo subsp. pepo]XP_023542254.1 very-long-chain 3-oxoacyl-CoA reductase-like protein At1g24470 [Cucurbita pepo subsp. pepo]XP_023542255.1 very-long-chain 3-oxoacyl-CoA reductase-like protein At1g24470 [Cucurbita pepo subsp. pepo]XP_023542256.1 very-long-chain 3-oxoacyl-CoA reductase-like protein At1g24470 [Cucurbita pepo subsp. pepo]XP_023542257.1 very-long-chain 3-oxoacyl-CoA reductase-like protein At1g24470 [Cucurbit
MIVTCSLLVSSQPIWLLALSLLGFLIILQRSTTVVRWVYRAFLRPPKDLGRYGSWGIVTGATDGIGKSFAYQLASAGLNLILISRSSAKLKAVSKDIRSQFPDTNIKIIELDFTEDDIGAGIAEIKEMIEDSDVGILINNVGITYPNAKFFHEVDEKVWMDVFKVNVKGTTWVTKAVLPKMIKKNRGAIVNIGSGAAVIVPSHPLYSIYAATKAYVDQFSRSLHVEYKDRGIDVQCQVPLYVATEMASRVASVSRASLFIPSSDDYVRAAIRRIGYEPRCTPYWSHSLQWCFACLLPEAVLDAWRLSIGLQRRRKESDAMKGIEGCKQE